MNAYTPTRTEAKRISELVRHYVENQAHFTLVLSQLNDHVLGDRDLMTQIHSVKWRVKDPNHLRDKLVRKLKEAKEDHLSQVS